MRRHYHPFNSKRYIGDANTMEVHDLENEKSECKINSIKSGHIRTFLPDALDEAKKQGYKVCAHCVGNAES